MNIKIKESPNITIKNCHGYTSQKTALYCSGLFIKDIKKYRSEVEHSMNSIVYEYDSFVYNVRLTKTGNIIISGHDMTF